MTAPRCVFLPGLVIVMTLALAGRAGAQDLSPTIIDPPAGADSMAPNLTLDGASVVLSWLEPLPSDADAPNKEVWRLRLARFSDDEWSAPKTIVEGVEFFINWADVPTVGAAPDGALLAGWLEKSGPATFAYDVQLARSTDHGATWTRLGPAHNDGTQTEHGFMSFVPVPLGVQSFWLDGRNMVEVEDDADADDEGHGGGNMTLRTALIGQRVTGGLQLDDRVCECCGTSAGMTDVGPIIAYRNRGPREQRDIWIARYDGMEWKRPQPVHIDNWIIPGCPVNGPALAAQDSSVVVAWYTAADNEEKVLASFSADNGSTFSEPSVIDDSRPVGRVDVLFDDTGQAIVCWLDTGMPDGVIKARRMDPNGSLGPPVTLAHSSSSRASGFPRIALLDGTLLLAWTQGLPAMRVRASAFEVSSIPPIRQPMTEGD